MQNRGLWFTGFLCNPLPPKVYLSRCVRVLHLRDSAILLRNRNRDKAAQPTAAVTLSRYNIALHSVAPRFPGLGGVLQENRATPPEKAL